MNTGLLKQTLINLLKEKRLIDRANGGANNLVSYDRWLVGAVEVLLQIELERQSAGTKAREPA